MWNFGSSMERISPYGKKWCKTCYSSGDKFKPSGTATSLLQCLLKSGDPWMKFHAPPFECTWLKASILVWQRRRLHSLCGRNYRLCTRRNPPHQSWYWFDSYSTLRWERRIQPPPTSTPSVGCYLNSPPKGSTSKKKLKPFPSFQACRRVGRYYARHSPTTTQS